jgi:exoribonuclease R
MASKTCKLFIDKTGLKQMVDNDSFQPITDYNKETIEVISKKLFPEDVFTYDSATGVVTLVHSVVRAMKNIPGVLIVSDFMTYGKRKNRSLYKCIPDDTRLPPFLVPYEIKHLGFFKDIPNLYVLIQFVDWDGAHPIATLVQTIGGVDVLEHFYEYQLFCKSLNHSIQKFNKDAEKRLKELDSATLVDDAFANISGEKEDRTLTHYVFTIDPSGCADYDDGFSVSDCVSDIGRDCVSDAFVISVYISNVPILLDALKLWDSFSQRVSTIYLPDKKRPMLPTILSDGLCSLQEKQTRISYTMDVTIGRDGIIKGVRFIPCKIRVAKNFVYDEASLLKNVYYNKLLKVVDLMSAHKKYIHTIQNSHDVVAYLMILMNHYCAKHLFTMNKGVFRVTKDTDTSIGTGTGSDDPIPRIVDGPALETIKFIQVWRSVCGQYVDLSSKTSVKEDLSHSVLNLDEYVHMTSPIRRIVDLLNMIMIQPSAGFSAEAALFVDSWLQRIDYINATMRSIRKVQSDCDFLSLCMNDETILSSTFDGYCFDRAERGDGLYQYNVFLPSLKMAYRITTREYMEHMESRKYMLYLFCKENKYTRKIRLQIV